MKIKVAVLFFALFYLAGILTARWAWMPRMPEFWVPGGLPSNGHIQTMEPIKLEIQSKPRKAKEVFE